MCRINTISAAVSNTTQDHYRCLPPTEGVWLQYLYGGEGFEVDLVCRGYPSVSQPASQLCCCHPQQ